MIKKLFSLFILPTLLLTSIGVLLLIPPAAAHETTVKGHISPSGLAATSKRYFILDLRSQEFYKKAHVPGAVLLPLEDISKKKLQDLGLTQDQPVVLYGTSENAARKAKVLLEVLGYTKLKILAGGFTHWQEDRQPVEKGLPSKSAAGKSVKKLLAGLEITPKVHDFGIIRKENGVVSTTFKVRNISGEDIDIQEITTSCGCTSAKMEPRNLASGKSGKLTVFFNPNFHKEPEGKFSRTVFLDTSNGREFQARIFVQIAQ